ncbi:MAG: hypothetical protein GX161_13915 [Firmicutes bacterium]|nr:hypothetical protein [Bacillota bacterium]
MKPEPASAHLHYLASFEKPHSPAARQRRLGEADQHTFVPASCRKENGCIMTLKNNRSTIERDPVARRCLITPKARLHPYIRGVGGLHFRC